MATWGSVGKLLRGYTVAGEWEGEKNEEGERVTDFAMAFDLSIVNTFFEKRPNHLVTYKSGGIQSQIKTS